MYYLQRSRYAEAIELNEQLNQNGDSGGNSATRKAIMERFCKANIIPSALLARCRKRIFHEVETPHYMVSFIGTPPPPATC